MSEAADAAETVPVASAAPSRPLVVEEWPVSRLTGYARNPRKNDPAVPRMVEVIREFGFRIPVVATAAGEVVDGHLRLKAAIAMGLETVPVAIADNLSPAQIKAFRLLANRSANWAEWDNELLRLEFEDLRGEGFNLALTGFDQGEIDALMEIPTDLMDPTEGEGEARGTPIPALTWGKADGSGKTEVPITAEEAAALDKLYRDHVDGQGVSFGFVREIVRRATLRF